MENIQGLVEAAVNSVIRPPRATYDVRMLGPEKFQMGKYTCKRTDYKLKNHYGFDLECSHYHHDLSSPTCADLPKSLPCVVYLHGNASCRLEGAAELLGMLLPSGISLFTFDFAGSGLSGGETISLGVREVEDVEVVVQHLRRENSGVSKIGIYGFSMGGASALMFVGGNHPGSKEISCLIVDSAFSSLPKLIDEIGEQFPFPSMLVSMGIKMLKSQVKSKGKFDVHDAVPSAYAEKCHIPGLFIHGVDDHFVKIHHSEQNFKKYKGHPKKFVKCRGDHNARPRPPSTQAIVWTFIQNQLLAGPHTEFAVKGLQPIGLAEVLRLKGNDCIKNEDWEEASICYTEAINSELALEQLYEEHSSEDAKRGHHHHAPQKEEDSGGFFSGLFSCAFKHEHSRKEEEPSKVINVAQKGKIIDIELLKALYANRSLALCKLGKLEEAMKDAEQTISMDDKWIRGYQRKAAVLMTKHQWEDARKVILLGLEKDPTSQQLKDLLTMLDTTHPPQNSSY